MRVRFKGVIEKISKGCNCKARVVKRCEIWVLNGDAVGLYLATDLMPGADFIKYSGHKEAAVDEGCGSDCTYYYNYGAVVANNANKLMRIVDVPISGACSATIDDLGALITPQTLIPKA